MKKQDNKENLKKIEKKKDVINNNQQSLIKQKQNQQQIEQQIKFNEQTKGYIRNILGKNSFQKNQISIQRLNVNSQHLIYALKQPNLINRNIIKKLILNVNQLTDEFIKQLCKKQWKKLEQLNLQYNKITIKGVQYLSNAAEKGLFHQLSYLLLSHNNISNNIIQFKQQQEQSLQEGLFTKFTYPNTKLKELALSKCQINDFDILRFFKSKNYNYKTTTTINDKQKKFIYLNSLSFSKNKITSVGMQYFARDLQQYTTSIEFYVSQNKIQTDGIKSLFYNPPLMNLTKCMRYQTQIQFVLKLKALTLQNCNLKSQSIKILVSNKNKFINLQRLVLKENPFIGDLGIKYFLRACQEKKFPKLLTVMFGNNNLSNNVIQYIVKDICPEKSLPSLINFVIIKSESLLNKKMIEKNLFNRFKEQSIRL